MTDDKNKSKPQKEITGSSSDYSASQITVLEGLEAVRKRPGMYIGNTGKDGLHRCFGEILDNSVDEFMAGHAKTIKVSIHNKHQYLMVSDDGRGIPTEIHPKTGKSALETIFTVLHAGGKFSQENYQFAGGLHGVGASVVNALSNSLEVWVRRGETVNYLKFAKGKTIGEIQEFSLDDAYSKFPEIAENQVWNETKAGTIVSFTPDESIFETVEFSAQLISDGLKQTAYLNPGLRIKFEHDGNKKSKVNLLKESIESLNNESVLTHFE
jgi:DNA gyrase subunit B